MNNNAPDSSRWFGWLLAIASTVVFSLVTPMGKAALDGGFHPTAILALRFGIADRGILKRGKRADIVVFDPNTISDSPGAGKLPSGQPKGIEHVFINGQHVVKKGSMIEDRLAGKVIRC